jgi:hypothetical protein
MKKDCYIADKNVQGFVAWLSSNLEKDAFKHSYWNRRKREVWSCSSLLDAWRKYEWNLSGFSDNECALQTLKDSLTCALKSGSDSATKDAAINVMTWGGVKGSNVNWLITNERGLAALLKKTQSALDQADTKDAEGLGRNIRFNAGMTKIYSLICNNFVIYDSRVAATLGWGVVKYCFQNKLNEIPEELCFPRASFRGGMHKRDASVSTLKFPTLRSGQHHMLWNLKASWLLESVLKHENAKSTEFVKAGKNALRALEAALFMIGYDLCQEKNDLPVSRRERG